MAENDRGTRTDQSSVVDVDVVVDGDGDGDGALAFWMEARGLRTLPEEASKTPSQG
jgi:hypothetical protein